MFARNRNLALGYDWLKQQAHVQFCESLGVRFPGGYRSFLYFLLAHRARSRFSSRIVGKSAER